MSERTVGSFDEGGDPSKPFAEACDEYYAVADAQMRWEQNQS